MRNRGTTLAADDVLLLPWHATGRLPLPQARRIALAIERTPDVAQQFAVIRQEQAGIIAMNERLGTPSPQALLGLFAAIDREPRESSCSN